MLCKKCRSPLDTNHYLCKNCAERYPFLYIKKNSDLYFMLDKGYKIGSFGIDIILSKVLISDDGSTMFFSTFGGEERITLMYYNFRTGNLGAIADNVIEYLISDNGELVYYIDISNTLYCFDQYKTEKIADIAFSIYISSNGEYLIYETADAHYLYNHDRKTSYLIEQHIEIVKNTPDFSHVYYIKDNDLYRFTLDLNKELMQPNVKRYIHINDNEFYYLNTQGDLCFHDEKGSKTLLDSSRLDFDSIQIKKACHDKPVIVFTLGLSTNMAAIRDRIALLNVWCLLCNTDFNSSAKKIAFGCLEAVDEKLTKNLCVYDIDKYTLKEIAHDVEFHCFLPNDSMIYGVWNKDRLLDIYIDDKKMDTGKFHEVFADKESNVYYIKTKRINGSVERDLYLYDSQKQKTILIAEDIIDFFHITKDLIYYYKDNYTSYELQYYNLYVFDGEKSRLLDFGVRKHMWLDRISNQRDDHIQHAYISGYDIYWIYFGNLFG